MVTSRSASSSALAVEAWQRIRDLARNPEAVAAQHVAMRESGLPVGPLRALRALGQAPAVSMRELAGVLGCDNSYVTLLVDTLEERGLARRAPHETDRRVKVVVLTDEGRAMAARMHAALDVPPTALGELTRSELATLCDLLRRVDSASG